MNASQKGNALSVHPGAYYYHNQGFVKNRNLWSSDNIVHLKSKADHHLINISFITSLMNMTSRGNSDSDWQNLLPEKLKELHNMQLIFCLVWYLK